VLAAWVAYVALVWAASPGHFWLDSGELAAAGAELGVVHPPGVPGYTLLLRLCCALPVGPLGLRMAAASSLCAAAAIGLIVAAVVRHGGARLTAIAAGVWACGALTFVRQARVAEIYGLGAVLCGLVLTAVDPRLPVERRTGARVAGIAAATWAATGYGDLRLALVPLVIAVLVADRPIARSARAGGPGATPWALLAAVVGVLPALALPLAAARSPRADWGDPDGWVRFVEHLQARSIREAFADEILPRSPLLWWRHGLEAWERTVEDLGPAGVAAGLLAIVVLLARGPRRPGAASGRAVGLALGFVVLVELGYAVGINPMGGGDRQTGMVVALLVPTAVGIVLAGTAARTGVRGAIERAAWPVVWLVLITPTWLASAGDAAVTRSWAPVAWTRSALAQLPPGGVLLVQSDDLAAGTLAAAVLEGARPDAIVVPAQHLYRAPPPGYERDPRLRALWDAAASGEGDAARVEAVLTALLAQRGAGRSSRPAVGLESPGTVVFAGVEWSDERAVGGLPLRLIGPGVQRTATAGALRSRAELEAEIERWLPRLPTAVDRRRLAGAVGARARGFVRGGGRPDGAEVEPPAAAQARAREWLELALARLDGRSAANLVALAALHDRAGDRARAIALTRRALELEPDRHAALLNLALYLSRDPSSRGEAIALARRAVHLRPWRGDGWQRWAQTLEAAGESATAGEIRREAAVRASAAR
jgi:hypothetical protein